MHAHCPSMPQMPFLPNKHCGQANKFALFSHFNFNHLNIMAFIYNPTPNSNSFMYYVLSISHLTISIFSIQFALFKMTCWLLQDYWSPIAIHPPRTSHFSYTFPFYYMPGPGYPHVPKTICQSPPIAARYVCNRCWANIVPFLFL
jgi:hypothetical protein